MAARVCICGAEILALDNVGPVASIASLKFYRNAAEFGKPASRQKCFLCDECAPLLIEFLKERQANGPGTKGVVE